MAGGEVCLTCFGLNMVSIRNKQPIELQRTADARWRQCPKYVIHSKVKTCNRVLKTMTVVFDLMFFVLLPFMVLPSLFWHNQSAFG